MHVLFYAFLQGIVLDVSVVIAKTPFCCNKASLGVLLITVYNKMTRQQLILDPQSVFVDFIFRPRYPQSQPIFTHIFAYYSICNTHALFVVVSPQR